MNKKEKSIMLNSYKQILDAVGRGFDKEDSKREIKSLLLDLGLEKDLIQLENKYFYEENNLTSMQVEGYENLNSILYKYTNRITEADNIFNVLENIKYNFTDEHKKCSQACINLIENY